VNRIFILLFCVLAFLGGEHARANSKNSDNDHNTRRATGSEEAPLTFSETFDGAPEHPRPWKPLEWDIAVHSRDVQTWDRLEKMEAAHSADCGPVEHTHTVTYYRDAVFQCRDHIMTAINASGYGVIYLTPNHMVDFSGGEAVIRFEMSTARTSGRDWIDLWITPYNDNLQLPLTSWLPDLSGEPRRAVQVEMSLSAEQTNFTVNIIRNFHANAVPARKLVGYENFLEPSAERRDLFELRISETHIKFGMPDYDFWWVDENIYPLGWTQGIVQIGHHSYNPTKDCATCGPNTWHWDNIEISPAVPFTINPARQRFADYRSSRGRFHLLSPAPENAHARFSAIGRNMEVSFDRGKSWQKAEPQMQKRYAQGAFWSYWMPIPAGTTQVQFRGQEWWGGNWRVKDLNIWSLEPASD
jgi:hypothetical protein